VFQSVADAQRAYRNTAENQKYCEHEISVHKKLLAEEIKQNKTKVFQLNLHEMELIRRTHDNALQIINECKSMSAERKQQAIQHVEQDTKKQQNAAESRNKHTARVLVEQQHLHQGHFEHEDKMNATLCDQKTALTKAYNEKKYTAFSNADFTHIVNFTRLDKTHFQGEKDATLNTIYKNHNTYAGIPAHRARMHGS